MNAKSIEAIICDQEMEVKETGMFKILSSWVKQDKENVEVGKRLVSNIQLCYMKPDHLKYVVKKCSFVAAADVDAALKEIGEEYATIETLADQEHMIVTGAGQEEVDGIYVRMKENIGMSSEDVMFVKEGDDYSSDHLLFLFEGVWAISPSVDSSSPLYTCVPPEGPILPRPPEYGWQTGKGKNPPPNCLWKRNPADKTYVAPNLVNAGTKKCDGDDEDRDEGVRKDLTLNMMMALPVDEDHENQDDYYGSAENDLKRMLNLPIDDQDEGDDYGG